MATRLMYLVLTLTGMLVGHFCGCHEAPDASQGTPTDLPSDTVSGSSSDSDETTNGETSSTSTGTDSDTDLRIPSSTDAPPCGDNGWQIVYPPHGASTVSAAARMTEHIVVIAQEDGAVSWVDIRTGGWRNLPPLTQAVGALVVRSSSEIYAIHAGGVFRYDGQQWQDLLFPGAGGHWSELSLFEGTDGALYAAGYGTQLWRYDDGIWTEVAAELSCPSGFTSTWLQGAWGTSDDDLYAKLFCDCFKSEPGCNFVIFPHTRLVHWNGTKWKVIDPSAYGVELAVVGSSEAYGLVPYDQDPAKRLRHYKNSVKSAGPLVPEGTFKKIAVDEDGAILLAGDTDERGANVAAWRAGQWTLFSFPGGDAVSAAVPMTNGQLVVGEQRGRVSLLDRAGNSGAGEWTPLNGPASDYWQGIAGSEAAGMVAVGSYGAVLRGSGTTWAAQLLEGASQVAAVAGTSGGMVAAGGLSSLTGINDRLGPGLWCGAPGESLHAVDLQSISADEATLAEWDEEPCDFVADIAAAPDAERLYAVCHNGYVLTLIGCEIDTVEKVEGARDWLVAIAAGPQGELFVGARFSVSHRDSLGWTSMPVPYENPISDVWRAPDTGELAALDLNGNVLWWEAGVLRLERQVPVGFATSMSGFSRSDIYVLGAGVSELDPSYLAHFDGNGWKWNDTSSVAGQRALAGLSSDDFYMASQRGVIGRVCAALF